MADVTISQLTPGTPSTGALLPYSQSGTTNSSTVANIGLALGVGGGGGGGSATGSSTTGVGGNGGSGIVVVRYTI